MPFSSEAYPAWKWLRINLGATMFILSLVSGIFGAVVSTTVRVVNFDYRMSVMERAALDENARLEALETHDKTDSANQATNRADVDERRLKLARDLGDIYVRLARLEALTKPVADLQARLDASSDALSALASREAVLESQNRFVADFINTNILHLPGGKR